MTAATQARTLAITINGTDYSAYLLDFSIGFESWQAGSGIVKKSGEISLTAIAGGVSLDPRDNGDFFPGAAVAVNWNGAAHPVGGSLLVLAPPTVEPILSDLPITASNIALKIPVGCALNYYSTNEPDDDASGVDLGATTNVYTAVNALLSAAGISSTSLSGALTIDFPIEKTSGGFVELAGQLYYSGSLPPPAFLYCDKANVVKGASVELDSASTLSIELGVSDKEYAPQLDASVPIGTMRAVGVHRKYSNFGYFKSVVEREDRSVTNTEISTYNGIGTARTVTRTVNDGTTTRGRLSLSDSAFVSIGFVRVYPNSISTLSQTFSSSSVKYEYTSQQTSEYLPFPFGVDDFVLRKTETSDSASCKVYNSDTNLLMLEYEDSYAWAPNVAEFFVTNEINKMIPARISLKTYEYDATLNLKKTVEYVGVPRITIAPDDANITEIDLIAETRAKQIYVESITTTEWEELKPGVFKEEKYILKARGILQPDFVAGDGAFDYYDYYELLADPASYVNVSNTGDTVPPRPAVWGNDLVEETQWEQSATFSQSAKQAVITVPYPFSPSGLRLIAEVEGEIQWGRSYQYLIECDPTIFASQESPMPIVRVYGAGENRIFLADAIQWFHTATEDFVGFAGIYLGGSGGDSGTGGSQSRVGTISPIIQTIIAEDDGTDASDEDAIALGIILNSVGYGVSYDIEVLATEV